MQDPPFLTGLLLRLHVVGKLHLPGQVATLCAAIAPRWATAPYRFNSLAKPSNTLVMCAPRCGQVTFTGARL